MTGRIARESSALQTLKPGSPMREAPLPAGKAYAPLMARLAASSGTLPKLSFSVRRIADVQTWGSLAEEELLDRRKTGPFYCRGSLIAATTEALQPAWETGSAAQVQAAMTAFMA